MEGWELNEGIPAAARREPQTPSTSPALWPRRKKQSSDEDKRDTQPSEFQILGSVGAARRGAASERQRPSTPERK